MRTQQIVREMTGELVGTLILVLLGVGVTANVSLGPQLPAFAYNWNTIALGWGLGYALAIFMVSKITGAHLNPAVTLALAARRDFPWKKVIYYIIAQIIGAFLGAAAVWFMYKDGLFPAGLPNIWATGPGSVYETAFRSGDGVSVVGEYRVIVACVAELLGTILLIWAYFASREVERKTDHRLFSAVIVGITVIAIGLSLGGPSGFAINPARDIGPRLWGALMGTEGLFDGIYWIIPPIFIPLFAGPLGAVLYDWLIKVKR